MATLKERMAVTAKPRLVPVEVDGWGTVHIAVLTVAEIDAIGSDTTASSIAKNFGRFICNEDGTRMFDVSNPADLKLLESQPFPLVQRLLKDINRINGISIEGEAEAKKA